MVNECKTHVLAGLGQYELGSTAKLGKLRFGNIVLIGVYACLAIQYAGMHLQVS